MTKRKFPNCGNKLGEKVLLGLWVECQTKLLCLRTSGRSVCLECSDFHSTAQFVCLIDAFWQKLDLCHQLSFAVSYFNMNLLLCARVWPHAGFFFNYYFSGFTELWALIVFALWVSVFVLLLVCVLASSWLGNRKTESDPSSKLLLSPPVVLLCVSGWFCCDKHCCRFQVFPVCFWSAGSEKKKKKRHQCWEMFWSVHWREFASLEVCLLSRLLPVILSPAKNTHKSLSF